MQYIYEFYFEILQYFANTKNRVDILRHILYIYNNTLKP